jgi:hypothetical protein
MLWLLLLLAVAGWWRWGRARARPHRAPYRYEGMLLLVGVPGTGKTVKMVRMLVQRLAEGRHVRCNFNVRHDRVYLSLRLRYLLSHAEALAAIGRLSHLDTFEDYVDAYDCDVFIDEAQDVCNAADWQLFPHEVRTWFAQHRHRRCRVVMASHKFGAIHNYLRELIAEIQLARPAPWVLKPFYFLVRGSTAYPLLQYVTIKDAEEEVGPSGPSKTRGGVSRAFTLSMVPVDPLVASCYDTHGGVRPSPMDAIRRSRGKGEVIKLRPRVEVLNHSAPAAIDALPALSHDELVALLRDVDDQTGDRRQHPAHVLAARWTWPRPATRQAVAA